MNIIPVILSGGTGTRLWPLSRASKPKQFLSFGTDTTLFQQTVKRCRSEIFDPKPIVVGSNPHRFLIAEDLQEIGVEADILLEPMPRNSAAAIAAGALQALFRDKEAVILVLSADHHIPDAEAFARAVQKAKADAEVGFLVTFGVTPSYPATGYGYIEPGEKTEAGYRVNRFCEKPDHEMAKSFIDAGFLWNSGNFLFQAASFLQELSVFAPEILDAAKKAYDRAERDLDFLRLDEKSFANAPAISVDYAVMEKTEKAVVYPVSYKWSDVGSWRSVGQLLDAQDDGNVVVGNAVILEGGDNFVHSTDKLTALVGMENTIVVTTRDAVLVADADYAEEVKNVVEKLKSEENVIATTAQQIFRPWGNYEPLDVGERYQVKRIVVKPGGELSLQKHKRRAEHWVVVSGQAEVTVGDSVNTLGPNEAANVPQGAVHRLANRGREPVILIEVQTGDYFGEDDIIRLEDSYNRGEQPKSVME